MDGFLSTFNQVFTMIGLPPELVGSALCVAFLLRFARASLPTFGPSKTYIAALLCGVLVEAELAASVWPKWQGTPAKALAFVAATLVIQFGLQKAGDKVPFLPADNEWVKQPDPPAAKPANP